MAWPDVTSWVAKVMHQRKCCLNNHLRMNLKITMTIITHYLKNVKDLFSTLFNTSTCEIATHLGTDCLLRPSGGYNFKTSPFLGGKFSLIRNARRVKFYDTALSNCSLTGFITETRK